MSMFDIPLLEEPPLGIKRAWASDPHSESVSPFPAALVIFSRFVGGLWVGPGWFRERDGAVGLLAALYIILYTTQATTSKALRYEPSSSRLEIPHCRVPCMWSTAGEGVQAGRKAGTAAFDVGEALLVASSVHRGARRGLDLASEAHAGRIDEWTRSLPPLLPVPLHLGLAHPRFYRLPLLL